MNKKQDINIKNTKYPNVTFLPSTVNSINVDKSFMPNTLKLETNIKNKVTFNEPFIFNKNKKESAINTIKYINNDTGRVRHYTPAAQEWFNSIYSYNKNYIKLLPIADKKILKLLKSYFNLFIDNKEIETKPIPYRYRKFSANKIFVGKGDIKHTSNKVIVTSYIYNAEQFYLKTKIKELYDDLFSPKTKELKKFITLNSTNSKEIVDYNRPHTLDEYLNSPNHPTKNINFPDHSSWHKNVSFRWFWKNYVELIGENKISSIDIITRKKLKKKNKYLKEENDKLSFVSFKDKTKSIFLKSFIQNISINKIIADLFNPSIKALNKDGEKDKKLIKFENEMEIIKNFYDDFDTYIHLAKEFRLKNYEKFRYLLMINNAKFEKPFIQKLIDLVKNVYNKHVEFNIINIYRMHLNSDIYTQSVSLKLKNRDNKLFRVLTRSLTKAKLPNVNRSSERYNKENKNEFLNNKIRNTYINTMFNYNSIDPLNNLLLEFFPLSKSLDINARKRSLTINQSITLNKYVIRTLKHMKLAGVRLEAKGRLTRRFTASKSVFRVIWKGGLENVDSSFKGLPAIMLRGDRKSNVEYSISSSKNRNGAFGVKGWIGSK